MYPYDETDPDSGVHEKQHALQRLIEDPLYWREQDPEFRSYVDNSFKSVYGNEDAERDATGRMIDPAPRPVTLPPFKPTVTEDDVNLGGSVGENQSNRWRDIWKVQKGLTHTGHYALDLTKEKSGERSPSLDQAIRDFQREKREETDGLLLPGGPTITRLSETLFGENSLMAGSHQGTAPRAGIAEPGHDQPEALQLTSQKPTPPGPGGSDTLSRGIQWIIDQLRKLPEKPGPRTPKQTPQDAKEAPQEKRAVIFTMPNSDAYVLLNPLPRGERRPHESSDFVLRSPGDGDAPNIAKQFDYRTNTHARIGFSGELPMYRDEADEVRKRIADGENVYPYNPRMVDKPMYPASGRGENRRQALIIRYYLEDGTPRLFQARHSQTDKPLWVPGDRPVEISAHTAVRLGLTDWMPIKPPRTNYPELLERESWKHFFPVPDGAEGLSR